MIKTTQRCSTDGRAAKRTPPPAHPATPQLGRPSLTAERSRRGKPRRPEAGGRHRAGRPWRGGHGRGGARPLPPRRLRSGAHSRVRALKKRSWLSRCSRVGRARAGGSRKEGRKTGSTSVALSPSLPAPAPRLCCACCRRVRPWRGAGSAPGTERREGVKMAGGGPRAEGPLRGAAEARGSRGESAVLPLPDSWHPEVSLLGGLPRDGAFPKQCET